MAKTKEDRLGYSRVGSVLTVTLPDESDSFSLDCEKMVSKLVGKEREAILVHLGKKLLQERTSSAVTTEDRFEQMAEYADLLLAGDFTKPRAEREKLPDWLKGKSAEIEAIGQILGCGREGAIKKLKEAGEIAGAKYLTSDKVKTKVAEMRAADSDLDALLADSE
jgi:hypothetical protein